MRQSFATTFSLTRVPAAAAFGLMLMPLVTSAVAAPETAGAVAAPETASAVAAPETTSASATPSISSPPGVELQEPVIDLQEDAAGKAGHCPVQRPCLEGPDVASERA